MEIIKLTDKELIMKIEEQWTEEQKLDEESTFSSSYNVIAEIKFKR